MRALGIGGRVRARRLELGIRQDELARMAGLSNTWLSRLENDLLKPRLDDVAKVARALDIPVGSLFDSAEGNFLEKEHKIRSVPALQDRLAVLADVWEWTDDVQKAFVEGLLDHAITAATAFRPKEATTRSPEHGPEAMTTVEDGQSRTIAKYRDHSDLAQKLLTAS
jgi:transcriptional regulator with XRE-family HTH domain